MRDTIERQEHRVLLAKAYRASQGESALWESKILRDDGLGPTLISVGIALDAMALLKQVKS